ncbi:leucyl aminopeptidase, partial [Nostocoides japonicum]|uniref:leucyl aminopeptidase n=1 Tax=Nostocoides japonicum TaxID=99481 RepID=UPI00065B5A4E
GAALRAVGKTASTVALALAGDDPAAVGASAEGAYAGAYRYDPKGAGTADAGPEITVVTGSKAAALRGAVERAAVLGARRAWAADLVNTPPNLLRPDSFADRVRSEVRASKAKVSFSVMDEDALRKAGCGGILGVGQGSDNPPRIVTLSYAPARPKARIAYVGKGITFDTGGYRIKPIEGMEHMKSDMAGAAAVAAAVLAAAELGLRVAVTGYLCLAENMISGGAQRPSDVVTMRNGTTVEVLDPDAEGRMVLADGMCLASERTPDALVDIATLTGMQVIALGDDIAGLMGNDEAFTTRLRSAASGVGEAMWVMPLPVDYRPQLDTPFADIAHKGSRAGGMLTAGIFLQEFVGEGIPWAHVDMAGPAYNAGAPKGYTPKGGTGWGVASLVALAESYAS